MPVDVPRIRALCFDVDGTLSDTDDQFVSRTVGYLRPLRRVVPDESLQRFARRFVMWAEEPGNILIGIPDTLGLDTHLAAVDESA